MFKSLATHLLQHLIAQNSWANAMLQPFAGKSVQINIPPISSSLVILEDGSLAMAGETNIADATVTIPPSLLLRLIAKDEAAKLQINISGDTHLASELAKVFTHMRWDYEDDLSKLTGDVPAYKVGQFSRQAVQSIKETSINLAEMLAEYWQEENPLIAKKRHVDAFNTQVDTLRADVERFEKRLAKLMQQHPTTNKSNGSAVDK
ncbi:MAG: SCP2 sterol-binding domain-containing protein [Pseudomonadota bacterium]